MKIKYILLILLLLLLLLASCSVYKPSNRILVKNNFVLHNHASPIDNHIFDVYIKDVKDESINSIIYYPSNNRWVVLTGCDGYTLSSICFIINSKQELELLLQDFK